VFAVTRAGYVAETDTIERVRTAIRLRMTTGRNKAILFNLDGLGFNALAQCLPHIQGHAICGRRPN
jgi:hypothetical protein